MKIVSIPIAPQGVNINHRKGAVPLFETTILTVLRLL
jgi:hypothetical protein